MATGLMVRLRATVHRARQGWLRHVAPPPPPVPDAAPGDTRAVCFAPLGRLPPLFFLHIPKTSGSSVNRMLAAQYGAYGMLEHADHMLPDLMNGTRPTMRLDCVSGHIPLCRWDLMRDTRAYGRAVILRDPWRRLVSHINWTDRFNHGTALPEHGKTVPTLTRVVSQLRVTDFTSRTSLQALFDAVQRETDFLPFDNMQVRMLTTGNPRSNFDRPGPGHLRRATANMLACDVRGICEDQDAFRADLANYVGQPARQADPIIANVGTSYGMTVDNDIAREIFAPWIALDQQLYDCLRSGRT